MNNIITLKQSLSIEDQREHCLSSVTDPNKRFTSRVRLPVKKECGCCHHVNTHSEIVGVLDDRDHFWFQCSNGCGSTLLIPRKAA